MSADGRHFVDRSGAPFFLEKIELEKIEARTVKAAWISPVTGERKDAGTWATGNLTGSVFPGAPTQFFRTPDFWEDAVLLLEASADPTSKTR